MASVSASTLRIAFSGSTSTPSEHALASHGAVLSVSYVCISHACAAAVDGSKAASYTGTPRSLGNHESVPLSFSPFSPQTMFTSSSLPAPPPSITLDVPMSWYCWNMCEPGNHCSGSFGTSRLTHDATPAKTPANTSRITHFAGPFRKLK